MPWNQSLAIRAAKDHTAYGIDCKDARRQLVIARILRTTTNRPARTRRTKQIIKLASKRCNKLVHRLIVGDRVVTM